MQQAQQVEVDPTDSDLEIVLHNAESILSSIDVDIQKLRRMDQALNDILNSRLYSKTEKQESGLACKVLLLELKLTQQDEVVKVVDYINQSKELWKEKQEGMKNMHEQDILDEEVAKIWNHSLSDMADRIEKVQTAVAFYHAESASPDHHQLSEEEPLKQPRRSNRRLKK